MRAPKEQILISISRGTPVADCNMKPDNEAWLIKLGVSEESFQAVATDTQPEPGADSESNDGSGSSAAAAGGSAGGAATGATLIVDNFSFGKTEVPSSHMSELKQLRARLAAAPGATVRLVGHTDTVGKEQFNVKLGQARAASVRAYLSGKDGLDAKQIRIESKGEITTRAGRTSRQTRSRERRERFQKPAG
jgi:outer membrane protein OmpA-like peptidoglycan-associated protein